MHILSGSVLNVDVNKKLEICTIHLKESKECFHRSFNMHYRP